MEAAGFKLNTSGGAIKVGASSWKLPEGFCGYPVGFRRDS